MSYLSASENVGFSGVSQTIPDGSCATQYNITVDRVSENHSSGISMYIQDGSVADQTYITHPNDNFFQTKFKIDPNELYTFHDSDIVTTEVTVGQTDEFVFDDSVDVKDEVVETSNHEVDVMTLTNGDIKEEVHKVISNGHYIPNKELQSIIFKDAHVIKDTNNKFPNMVKSLITAQKSEEKRPEMKVLNSQIIHVKNETATQVSPSISNVTPNSKTATTPKQSMETFLDVFKREQGLVENQLAVVKTECMAPPDSTQTVVKIPIRLPDKKPSTGKQVSHLKSRRGRGPAVHEALQRLPSNKRVEVLPNGPWHAPGDLLFDCGPLDDKSPVPFKLDSSSSDEDYMPDFGIGTGPACVEESAAETRAARLALRRAALRRHVTRAETSLRLMKDFKPQRALAAFIKKQLNNPWNSGNLPTHCVNHLLAMRGMTSVLTSQERRKLRESGWSGGESGSTGSDLCTDEGCNNPSVPCAKYCLNHITLSEQRLYGVCGATCDDGARCRRPVVSVPQPQTFCAVHQGTRDNYDKLVRETKQPKPRPPTQIVRRRIVPASPRRAKRRRRPPTVRAKVVQPPNATQSLSELNACSNSSTYDDSSEEVAMEGFGQNDFIIAAADSHELEVEVGHVSPDDILDPAVLSQIPDEAFTEFFNQAEGGATFAESSELTAALEAVLDERVLDERVLDERSLDTLADCVFTHSNARSKFHVPTTISLGMPSGAPS